MLIVVTRRWHGRLSLDSLSGPQKVQRTVVPRIGGVAVFAGYWAATLAAPPPIRGELAILGACGLLAFGAGLAEDFTKKVSGTMRMSATLLAGLLFSLVTGHVVARVEIGFVDHYALAYPWIAIPFTAFAMAGIAHSVNIIDGFNGLSAGGVLIMLAAFGVVALQAGDDELAALALLVGAAVAGFLLVNFPRGPVIMGDGGAYLVGFLLAAVGVMLPQRNPEVSPMDRPRGAGLPGVGNAVLDPQEDPPQRLWARPRRQGPPAPPDLPQPAPRPAQYHSRPLREPGRRRPPVGSDGRQPGLRQRSPAHPRVGTARPRGAGSALPRRISRCRAGVAPQVSTVAVQYARSASEGNRTPVTSLGSSGNDHYTTLAL